MIQACAVFDEKPSVWQRDALPSSSQGINSKAK
jgi:hypothetical protein